MSPSHNPRYKRLVDGLRRARLDAGLTQEAVAARLGVHQSYISKVENNQRRIDPIELCDLAALYGRRPEDFLSATE